MWLGGQQKQPVDNGEGQIGIVTVSGGGLAVMLDSERRGLEQYSPGGYRWTPKVGQRVLVMQGKGEIPCVIGARQGGDTPDQVGIQAQTLDLTGKDINATARMDVTIKGGQVSLNGQVRVNGERLEDLIARIVDMTLGKG